MNEPQTPSSDRDGPYADHPLLSALPRELRQRIADQIEHDSFVGAVKIVHDAFGQDLGLKGSKDVIDGLRQAGTQAQSGKHTGPAKLATST